ncbi:hypothetical protein NQ315_012160 [Exocentrus adspersus]|uniref:Cadherin domain-containing protein n=1 Tax=Exocentrus adspersus TaxID=1586481 RepID=A0AAV8VY82_9CUCU|nr:hypothetical protein NQ315_012160 [Exocentrus adspersus]
MSEAQDFEIRERNIQLCRNSNLLINVILRLIGDIVGQLHAIDPDLGRNGYVTYSIQKAPNNSIPFDVDSKTGQIVVAQEGLQPSEHLLFVEASDQPVNPSEKRSSLAVITVDIRDHDENQDVPDFIGAPYEFWVGGNVDIGTSVGQIRITDSNNRGILLYDLLHSYHEGVPFAVEEKSGTITVVDDLKKYSREHYDFETVVTNERDLNLVTNVTIHVVDPKDEKTILMKTGTTPVEFHVKENEPNVLIGKLGFKTNSSNSLKFTIANQKDVTDHISITPDGTLYTQNPLDRETRDIYRLTIIAEYNKGSVLGTGIYLVNIIVDDENDSKPTFERASYEGRIRENSRSGTEVDLNYPIHVSDDDIGENGQFTVTIFGNGSEYFRLDRNLGKIQFTGADTPLDRERTSVYNLRLVAKDNGGLSSEAKLTIQVEDENDNIPSFVQFYIYPDKGVQVLQYDSIGNRLGHFEEASNSTPGLYVLTQNFLRILKPKEKMSPFLSVPEDIAVGSSVVRVIAEDKDDGENSVIKYEMVSETYIPNELSSEPFHIIQYFMVQSTTGEIMVARALPAESEFRLNVSASDRSGLRDHLSIRITVRDVNDHPPVFKKSWYNFDAEEASYTRNTLGKIEATDADFGQNANITYFIKNGSNVPFSISPTIGTLRVEGLLDRETQDKYTFVVVAKDNPKAGKSLSSSVSVEVNVLDVNDNPPVFYGYDDLIPNPEANTFSNHNYQEKIPVYYATAAENSPIGKIDRTYLPLTPKKEVLPAHISSAMCSVGLQSGEREGHNILLR